MLNTSKTVVVGNEILKVQSQSYAETAALVKSYNSVRPMQAEESLGFSRKKDMRDQMQTVVSYFSEFKPSQIKTPFQGTCLLMSKDKSKFYFGSREGRIAIARVDNKEILHDIDLKEGTIRTIALYQNDKYLFSGGHGGSIKKFLIEDMSEIDNYYGYKNDIDVILISSDEKFLYSIGDEGTVLMWDLTEVKPKSKELYSHGAQAYCMTISTDNSYLASAGSDKIVKIYNLIEMKIQKNLESPEFGVIWCLKITDRNNFIAFGDDIPNLYVFQFVTWEKLHVFQGHSQKVRSITATSDEKYIITGGNDSKIIVWNIKQRQKGLVLNGHTNGVKAVILSEDQRFLYSLSDDSSIKSWKIPRFNNYYGLKTEFCRKNIGKMLMGKKLHSTIYLFYDKEISAIDRGGSEYFIERFNVDVINCFAFSLTEDVICIVSTQKCFKPIVETELISNTYSIILYDYCEKKYIQKIELESYGIYSVVISADSNFVIIGEMHRVKILNYSDMNTVYHIFRSHKNEIVSIIDSPNGDYLFSGDSQGVIKSYDFRRKYEIKSLIASDKKVIKMIVTPDNEYMIANHEDFVTNIWAVSKMIKLHTMQLENSLDIKFPRNSTIMFTLYETSIKGFYIPSFTSCFSIRLHEPASKFCFTVDEKEIGVYNQEGISIYLNPLQCNESILSFGELDYTNYFYQQIGKLVAGKYEKHESIMNHWIIEPFHINIMHLYAYLDKHKFLQQCFAENVGCFVSKSGFSPLDICLDMEFEKCIDVMYTEIKKFSKKNPLFLSILENSLLRLNKSSYKGVFKFYKLAIYKTIDTRLPKFYNSKRELPIIILNVNVLAHKSSFMRYDEYSNEGTGLSFKQTYFKIDMVSGSSESIKLVRSIIETNNEEIFQTDFIQLILSEKWKKVRIVLYFQAIIYLAYLVCLAYFAITGFFEVLIITFSINILLIIYELGQFLSGKIEYFKDAWNYIDLISSGLCFFLFFEHLLTPSSYENDLIAIVLFFSLVRGISYFRLFKSTRYYINLIYEVIFDIIPFLTIVFYSTIGFGLVFRSIMNEDNSQYYYIKSSWEINVGGFDTSNYGEFMYLAFFLNTLLNPIILLNLLISIMSNTYDRVNNGVIIADSKELAGMILEGELTFFWNRNNRLKHYLHICTTIKKNEIKIDPVLQKIKTKINQMSENHNALALEFGELKKEFKEMKDSNEKKLDYITEILLLNLKK